MSLSTRPVLGYLTTSWTPPASCLSVEVSETTPPWSQGWQGQTCLTNYSDFTDASDCWPPRTANAPKPPGYEFLSGWGFYSPGTLCPSGFTTACVATYGQPVSGWSLQFPLTAGETAAGCCPSGGYTCYDFIPWGGTYGWVQTCRLLATSTTMEVAPCLPTTDGVASQLLTAVVPYTTTTTTDSVASTSTIDTLEVMAPLIQINWRVVDLTTAIPKSTSSGSVPTSTSVDSVPTSTSADSGRTISGGAIAGIVIGAVFGLAGIAIGIARLLYMRRGNTRGTSVSGQSQDPDGAPGQQELKRVKPQPQAPQSFALLATDSVQELQRHELMDEGQRAEMQG